MFANLTGWHLIALLVVVVILFGATRLPALARGVGQSVRILRTETRELKDAGDDVPPVEDRRA